MSTRGITLSLRYLGIVLPVVVICFRGWQGIPHFAPAGYAAISLFIWFAFSVVLAVRRDWSGALAIGVMYLIADVPFILLVFGHPLAGMRDMTP